MDHRSLLHTLVEEIGEALVSWTVGGRIAVWNKAAERLLGYKAAEVLGRDASLLVPAGLLGEHQRLMSNLLADAETAQIITQRRHASGALVNVSLSFSRLCNRIGQMVGVGCVLRPASDATHQIEHLRQRARTDPLTGVLNRAGMEEVLARPSPWPGTHRAVLFIDLDGFKRVNDELGHRQGDVVLVHCARRIHANLPDAHALARWGGDEFVAVLDHLPAAYGQALRDTEIACTSLQAAMRPHYSVANRQYFCPASIGACVFHPASTSGSDALEFADRAMYQVKASRPRRDFMGNHSPTADSPAA